MSCTLQNADREFIVAVHEAGHAVACVKLGVPFSCVEVDISGEGFEAGVDCRVEPFPKSGVGSRESLSAHQQGDFRRSLADYSERCRKQVIVCFAGRAAEERAVVRGLTKAAGAGSDLKDLQDARHFIRESLRAENVQRSFDGQELPAEQEIAALPARFVTRLEELRVEAEELVAGQFGAVERVARMLVVRKRLTLAEVVKQVHGD